MKISFNLLFLYIFIQSPFAWSWGDLGHSAVGEIAERNLTEKGKALVKSILGVEPLAVAATWPDHVRDDKRFKEFAPYHFWDMKEGESAIQKSNSERGPKDAHTIVSQAHDLLIGSKLNRAQKMIFLRYFIHILGDVHQPLHLGNPLDMGGNTCKVKVKINENLEEDADLKDEVNNQNKPNAEDKTKCKDTEITVNLHSFWDSKIIDLIKQKEALKEFFSYNSLIKIIQKDVKLTLNDISGTPLEWYEETRKLIPSTYPDKEPTAAENHLYCRIIDLKTKKSVNGKFDESKIPLLDDQYITTAMTIVKKQLLLGGLRLAYLLNKIAEDFQEVEKFDEFEVLKGVLIKNENLLRRPSSKSMK